MNTEKPLVPQGPQIVAPASRRLVFGSLIVACLAMLLPWPRDLLWLAPDFALVVLIYWLIHAPHLANLGLAMGLGLLADLSLGNLLGQHALTYTVTAFVVIQLRRRLDNFEVSGRALHLAPLFMGEKLLFLVLGLAFGLSDVDWRYLASALTGLMLWVPLALLFDRLIGWSNEMRIEPAAK